MKKNYFWGIFLILAAAYLIISRLGFLPAVGAFNVLATIACIALFVHSVLHLSFGGMLFPLAFIGILYDEQLGITAITPWTILLAALLGTIGLNMVFSKQKWKKKWKKNHGKYGIEQDKHFDKGEKIEGEYVYMKSSFGSLLRYVTSEDLKYAELEANFSGVKIYFDNAKVPSGNATLNIDINFSGVELYIPAEWKVINHLDCSVGGISEKGKAPAGETITLTLDGDVSFSGITVYYV
jgi:Predicted membrane protein (DUF2154).